VSLSLMVVSPPRLWHDDVAASSASEYLSLCTSRLSLQDPARWNQQSTDWKLCSATGQHVAPSGDCFDLWHIRNVHTYLIACYTDKVEFLLVDA